MKILELTLAIAAALGLILAIFDVHGMEWFTGATFSMLSLFYLGLSFAVLNKITFLSAAPISDQEERITSAKIIVATWYGCTVAATIFGMSMKIQFGAATELFFLLSLMSFILTTLSIAIWYFYEKSNFHKRVFVRSLILGIIALMMLVLPIHAQPSPEASITTEALLVISQ